MFRKEGVQASKYSRNQKVDVIFFRVLRRDDFGYVLSTFLVTKAKDIAWNQEYNATRCNQDVLKRQTQGCADTTR